MILASTFAWAALAALVLFVSALSRRGVLLSLIVFLDFIFSVGLAAYMNHENLWQYRESHYVFYLGYAAKDFILIAILSIIHSRITWLACLAFLPSMIYHFLVIIEIHHQYYPLDIFGVELNIISTWNYFNLSEGNNLFLQPIRTEIMRGVCSLQIASMVIAIYKDGDGGGKYVKHFIYSFYSYFSNAINPFHYERTQRKEAPK